MATPTNPVRRALGNRNYALYTVGNGVSLVGTWVQRIAVGWLMWRMTHSEAWLGGIAFADLFPTVLIGPFGGALADRLDRLRLLKASQLLMLAQSLALFLLTAADAITPFSLFLLTALGGVFNAVNQPARLALVSRLVDAEAMAAAVAINATVFNTARFVGPAVAGAVIAISGVPLAFAVNAASFVIYLAILARFRLPPQPPSPRRHSKILAEISEGVVYAARHPGMGPLFQLLIVGCLAARPAAELLPGFADLVFHAGATGLASMTAAIGIGAVAGGTWMAGRARADGLIDLIFAGTTVMGVSIMLFASTDSFAVALAALVAAGVAMVMSSIGTQTLIQLSVEPSMRGRVLSLYGLIYRGGPALGALLVGTVAERAGLAWPILVGAGVSTVCGLRIWRQRGAMIRSLERSQRVVD
ncbi:MFS transporter [Azospirillum sp.]|uniref:MFS transporter n=1 Tax=Azospirillum sp. TaxID=34012 RepID=UPI00262591E0|nr:MFS transporter [Azospirillum sp.]